MNEKQNPDQEIPNELAEKMNQWRKANPEATLTTIEEEVDAELAKIRGQLVTALAQAGENDQPERPACPDCGAEMVRNGRKKRKLEAKEGQTIQLERQHWRCLQCGATLFPPG